MVFCTKCRNAKGVDLTVNKSRCTRCGKLLSMDKLKVYHRSDSQKDVAIRVGVLNAKSHGIDIPEKEKKTISDPYARALRESIKGSNERERLLIIARILTMELGSFDKDDLESVIELMGVGDVDDMIASLKKIEEVYEPKEGTFKALDP